MSIKIVSILQAIIISSISLLYSGMQYENNGNCFPHSSTKNNHFYLESGGFYMPVSAKQEFDNSLNKLPSEVRSNYLLNFDLSNKVKELLFGNISSKYIYYSVHIIRVSLKKSDIIYPFNYFW